MERLHLVVRHTEVLERLPLPVLRIARLCDGARTLDGVIAASDSTEAHTRSVVSQLRKLGLVSARPFGVVRERIRRLIGRTKAEGSASHDA